MPSFYSSVVWQEVESIIFIKSILLIKTVVYIVIIVLSKSVIQCMFRALRAMSSVKVHSIRNNELFRQCLTNEILFIRNLFEDHNFEFGFINFVTSEKIAS